MNEHNVNAAASALTSWKHRLEHPDAEAQNAAKRARTSMQQPGMMMGPSTPLYAAVNPLVPATIPVPGRPEMRAAPFFYYNDHSTEEDPDPLTPLTFPGRVPNFPAKLHAILSRPDFADIIDWLPHGRSWRVLKPRDFETKIIPKFFEHSKFSSFVRQANGWGFRRITQGPDRNSYYHQKFLRGLPHLCKTMKRPGVSEKRVVDPDLEPDFYKISEYHPVPNSADEESIFLQKTLQSGPKSRMPIITTHFKTLPKRVSSGAASVSSEEETVTATLTVAPSSPTMVSVPAFPAAVNAQASYVTPEAPAPVTNPFMMQMQMPLPALDGSATAASSSFAAGFAAATAHYQQHFYTMMSQMAAANQPKPEGQAPEQPSINLTRSA